MSLHARGGHDRAFREPGPRGQGSRPSDFRDPGLHEAGVRDPGLRQPGLREEGARAAIAAPVDARAIGRLTWLGLAVAVLGWMLLLGEAAVSDGIADLVSVKLGKSIAPTFHGDVIEIAKCLIGSGFGLAVLGGLQSGFGALDRFFTAVLTRSAQRAAPVAEPEPVVPDTMAEVELDPAPTPRPTRTIFGSAFRTASRSAAKPTFDAAPVSGATREPEVSVMDRDAPSLREQRPYTILPDGSVEVETILGTRRFATMHEARDFI